MMNELKVAKYLGPPTRCGRYPDARTPGWGIHSPSRQGSPGGSLTSPPMSSRQGFPGVGDCSLPTWAASPPHGRAFPWSCSSLVLGFCELTLSPDSLSQWRWLGGASAQATPLPPRLDCNSRWEVEAASLESCV